MDIKVTGLDKALKMMADLPANVRKASAKSINDTLKDVQRETGQDILPDAFTLRGRGKQWWEPGQKFGFNIRPFARPESLEGVIGSQADWLKEQEHGGTRTRSGNLAIPASDYKGKTEIMRKAIKPRAITKKKNVFFAELRSGLVGIFKRISNDTPLKLLFSLKHEAHIKPILHFEKRASEFADKRLPINFAKRFAETFFK